ncbi:MAG TPA: type II secretion system protein [Opitutaceae bacterium]|nr:type II secretion system protein [Opitutaceae bacterium]
MTMFNASTCRIEKSKYKRNDGFTLIEVMMAVIIMAFAISSSIPALQRGFLAIDVARNTTIGGQILQSMIEDIRLLNWSQVSALPASQAVAIDSSFTGYNVKAAALLSHFSCTRTVTDVSGLTNVKSIVLTVTWTGYDNRAHSLNYNTYYAKNGISDYFYTSH